MFRRSRRPRPVILDTFETMVDNKPLSVTLKGSYRSRYVRLEFRGGGLIVTIPRTYRRENVKQLLEEKQRWISRMLDRYGAVKPDVFSRELNYGDFLPYLGRSLKLEQYPGSDGTAAVILDGDNLIVSTDKSKLSLQAIVSDWYRQQAKRHLATRVDELSGKLGIACGKVSVRQARTRWGSCSRQGNLSFNWKIMIASSPVIDYVVVHELSHIKEMNHSHRFWKLVADACPQWREHRQWLKEHEAGSDGKADF